MTEHKKQTIVRDIAPIRSSDGLCGGQIHPPRRMFLRVHCGEAKAGKLKYEMATAIAGMPIVESKQTGKWFTLSWQAIIAMAVKAGIDEPHNEQLTDLVTQNVET